MQRSNLIEDETNIPDLESELHLNRIPEGYHEISDSSEEPDSHTVEV